MDEKEWDKRPPAKMTLDLLSAKEGEICELKEKHNKIELTIVGMEKDLGSIKETLDTHIDDQKKDTAALIKKMDDFIVAADTKYAPIMVYRILVWAGGIAGAALIIGLLGLIYRAIVSFDKF